MSNIDNNIQSQIDLQLVPVKNILKWEPIRRQMTYIDFVKTFDRDERTKHINYFEIESDCGHRYEVGKQKHNLGKILSEITQVKNAVKNLAKFILKEYNIELIGTQTGKVHLCHLCKHDSTINATDASKHACTNPAHMYFGTVKENHNDVDPDGHVTGGKLGGRKGGAKGMRSQMAAGTHTSQIRNKCPHCEYETTEVVLGRHSMVCHFNPSSYRYLRNLTKQQIERYQKQGLQHKIDELNEMRIAAYQLRHG